MLNFYFLDKFLLWEVLLIMLLTLFGLIILAECSRCGKDTWIRGNEWFFKTLHVKNFFWELKHKKKRVWKDSSTKMKITQAIVAKVSANPTLLNILLCFHV